MNITVEIKAPELVSAIQSLAASLGGKIAPAPMATQASLHQAPVPQAAPQQPVFQPAPQAAPIQPMQQPAYQSPAPQQPAPAPIYQQPTGVPVAPAPQYTIDQLGVAASPLVDAGRGPELAAWLQSKGAQALTQLDKSLYGEFALYLRSLGAKI